jgi:hypothetical protein
MNRKEEHQVGADPLIKKSDSPERWLKRAGSYDLRKSAAADRMTRKMPP